MSGCADITGTIVTYLVAQTLDEALVLVTALSNELVIMTGKRIGKILGEKKPKKRRGGGRLSLLSLYFCWIANFS